jgi:hypothetical protein
MLLKTWRTGCHRIGCCPPARKVSNAGIAGRLTGKTVMHTPVLFEHPLNEKMRTWLRIEFLTQQLSVHPTIASHADALHFFRNAGDLLDVLERGEVAPTCLKSWNASSVNCSHGQKSRRRSGAY